MNIMLINSHISLNVEFGLETLGKLSINCLTFFQRDIFDKSMLYLS